MRRAVSAAKQNKILDATTHPGRPSTKTASRGQYCVKQHHGGTRQFALVQAMATDMTGRWKELIDAIQGRHQTKCERIVAEYLICRAIPHDDTCGEHIGAPCM